MAGPIFMEQTGGVASVMLNRPKVHNAFDAATIVALAEAFRRISDDPDCRVVVLSGAGPSFSAGGDLHWMRETAGYSIEKNIEDARGFASMLEMVDRCPKPIVGRVHGVALGGGVGLLSTCDVVVAADDTKFGLSEVRLGLVPAVISPYVVRRIGPSRARALMLTGERFDAGRALAIGLVDEVVKKEELVAATDRCVAQLLAGGPQAQATIKELVRQVAGRTPSECTEVTARAIAEARSGDEGREGTAAFLEKRKPKYAK